MVRMKVACLSLVAISCVVLLTAPALAQQSPSGIAGVVKDTSGAVLPGVTVEAASPALIEKVRTVVTDTEGRYNIVNLRPGTYTVTFTLSGFSTSRREGIILTAGFTATVNADMKIGALEETITVTGEAPLVDTQNVRQQKVLSDDVLTSLPTGQTNVVNIIALTPGLTGNATVGASTGSYHAQQRKGSFHGKRGSHLLFDGGRIDNNAGSGDSAGYIFNSQLIAEMAIETGGAGADSGAPNVGINMVPKEGGNTFSFAVAGSFTNHGLQGDNLDDALRARGVPTVPGVDRTYDIGMTLGGPIKRDRLWFFSGVRRWGTRTEAAGLFWNKTQGTMFYTPDLNRPAVRDERYQSHAIRLTWQVSAKHKANIFADIKKDCICLAGGAGSGLGAGSTQAQEGESSWRLWPNGIIQGTWNSPRTNKLLLEAGATVVLFHWPDYLPPGVSEDHVRITEASTGFSYGAPALLYPKKRIGDRYSERFSLSYVTGSHAFKTGFQWDQGYARYASIGLGRPGAKGVSYEFRQGVPVSLTQRVAPIDRTHYQKAELGIYAQDQWVIKRLTLNLGLRFDYFNGYIPAQRQPATDFVPVREFAALYKAPEWKALNPRAGASYDLFGNGRTAAKVSFGRYVAMTGVGTIGNYHPAVTSVNQTDRSWNDANRNYIPDCDLANFGANGECGPIANQNFGKANPNAVVYADDVRYGWKAWPWTWDISTEVQHELRQGLSLTAGYYHNWDGGFTVTENSEIGPEDFDPYCITAPIDARLPNGGGYEVCGLYDIKPEKFGRVRNVVTQASNFGPRRRVNDFFGVTFDARFGQNLRMGGGVDAGRTVDDNCLVVDSPGAPDSGNVSIPHVATIANGQRTCKIVTPLAGTTQIKLNGSYPLPAGFVVSGTFQNVPGAAYEATYSASNAQIAPSLGRNLAGGRRSVIVPLVPREKLREPRRTQVDLRFTKAFNVRAKGRVEANVDIYNAFNANSVLGMRTRYGSTWLQPSLILTGRLIQFSGRWSF